MSMILSASPFLTLSASRRIIVSVVFVLFATWHAEVVSSRRPCHGCNATTCGVFSTWPASQHEVVFGISKARTCV
jgi:hypothetical protein